MMAWETKEDRQRRAALRYRNARYLMLERCQGKVARFARTIKASHSYTAAYIGEKPTKRIGDKVAQRIESAFTMQPGWLDEDRSAAWDKRLKAATGPTVHPLDATDVANEWQVANPDQLMAEIARLPDNLTEAMLLGDVIQQRYASVREEIARLEKMQYTLVERSSSLYFEHFENQLLRSGFVVKSPGENNAPVFRVWHPNPDNQLCLEIRLSIQFSPVLEFRPLPPAVMEVQAVPYVIQQGNQHRVYYFFFGLNERITAFDVSHIRHGEQGFELRSASGEFRMYLDERQQLERFFN